METCSVLSPITPLKMKIPSGQETFNYTIDQSYLKDYELLIWAVKNLITCQITISVTR